MKNNLLNIICVTLLCAVLMLGIMGLYKSIASNNEHFGQKRERHIYSVEESFELSDRRISGHL